ncbi:collagen binding domain-containing protein [Roseateles sp. BYS78W]|uniref:Collagen binding domain-containing protein n=1 Tax=Pelomonas candidula TaxID=3299025 RepID=A0ABW7HKN9_9BURK
MVPKLKFVALLAWATLTFLAEASAPAADPTGCVASAQNRSVPLTSFGDFVLTNLPGSGFVPFGTVDAQPFRVRVTCNDGTVGETALAFPMFEQSLVQSGPIVWGQSTPVPTQLRLDLPSYVISPGNPNIAGQVTARYADGNEKNVTARTSGTGYRSSSAGFVGVSNDGRVYLQSADTLSSVAAQLPVPSIITITAENDGVVSSRLVQLVSSISLSGKVAQADNRDARGIEVRLSIAGYDDLLTTTDSAGNYRFSSLPLAVKRYADLLVLDRVNRRMGGAKVWLDANGNGQPPQIVLQGGGRVRISVVDAAGSPQAGVSVGVSDAYARALGLAPSMLTADANGQVEFQDVPAGTVVAVSNAAGYAAVPGQVLLAAGAVAAITLRATGASPASQAAIVGQVLQQPSLTAAVGATIELLEDKPGAAPMRQVVDGSGRFSFAGLPVNTLFNYQVKVGAEVLANGGVYTGLAGSQRALNVELSAQRGLSGIVVATDGLTPAPGVAVQLSYFDGSIQTWTAAGTMTSRADGSFVRRYLEPRRYRLQALAVDGSSATIEVDLSTAPPNSMQNNLRLQLALSPAQVKLGLRATVLGAADFGPLGAELFVRNSSCPAWCGMGQLPTTTATLTTDFLGQGRNDFELRWRGRVQAFSVDVGPSNDGQTVSRVIDFGPDVSGVNRIPAQRSLYSFNVAQGDSIYAAVLGRAQDGVAAAAAVKYELYDCWRRSKFDPPCRLNFDPGLGAGIG